MIFKDDRMLAKPLRHLFLAAYTLWAKTGWVVVQISAATLEVLFATYKRQQTMLERQRRLNFLPAILFQATTMCDNSIAGPRKKT